MDWAQAILARCWFKRSGRVRSRAAQPPRYTPRLEWLETRDLLSAPAGMPPLPPWSGPGLSMSTMSSTGGPAGFILSDEQLQALTAYVSQTVPEYQPPTLGGDIDARTIWLGDLSGNGLPDLLVADTANNRVLLALGQPGGGFGPFQQFNTGIAPVGITVADVIGDGQLDVLVANEGSNTVSLLLGQNSASGWSLSYGQVMQVGAGPVDTVVQNIPSIGGLALFVCDSLSDDVYELRSLGDGTFDDAQPIIYEVGQGPEAVFLGHFHLGSNLDLMTVNALSHDLTYFSGPDFMDTPAPGRSIPFGDHQVVAALMSDLMSDGMNDVALADSGQGEITFVLGTAEGPVVGQTINLPNMPNPTGLFASSNPFTFLVVGQGQSQMALVAWPASDSQTLPEALPPNLSALNSDRQGEFGDVEVSLLPLSESGIEFAATVAIPASRDLASLASSLETQGFGGEFAVGAREQPRGEFRESDDALFRFASGQQELLERAHGVLQALHDQEGEATRQAETVAPPSETPQGPDLPWMINLPWGGSGPVPGNEGAAADDQDALLARGGAIGAWGPRTALDRGQLCLIPARQRSTRVSGLLVAAFLAANIWRASSKNHGRPLEVAGGYPPV